MTGTEKLTATDLLVLGDVNDAPGALAALLMRYPLAKPDVRDWTEQIHAFAVLLRSWMTINPGTALELTLGKLEYSEGGLIFTKRQPETLATDFLVDTILATTGVSDPHQQLGLSGKLSPLFCRIYVRDSASAALVQVLLTPYSLIIGGQIIWQA